MLAAKLGKRTFLPPFPLLLGEIFVTEVSEVAVSSAKCRLSLAEPAGERCVTTSAFGPKVSSGSWTAIL